MCARITVNHNGNSGNDRAHLQEGFDSREWGTAGGGGVFEDDDAFSGEVWPFDLATATVVFWLLANDKSVIILAERNALVEHRGRDGVCPHGEAADRRDIRNFGNELHHDLTNEGSDAVVKAHPSEIDVIGGFFSAREREVTVEYRISLDELNELLLRVRHPTTLLHQYFFSRDRRDARRTTSVGFMRIATWNVNSIRTRAARVVDWLVREDIDVVGMQEIKCKPDQFPTALFEEAGYEVIAHGLNQWNGVAFASRLPMSDVATSFAGQPGFLKGEEGPNQPLEARALGATVDGVRLWSLYVPNGRALDDPHYRYKLEWLQALPVEAPGWMGTNAGHPLP